MSTPVSIESKKKRVRTYKFYKRMQKASNFLRPSTLVTIRCEHCTAATSKKHPYSIITPVAFNTWTAKPFSSSQGTLWIFLSVQFLSRRCCSLLETCCLSAVDPIARICCWDTRSSAQRNSSQNPSEHHGSLERFWTPSLVKTHPRSQHSTAIVEQFDFPDHRLSTVKRATG